jgi:hypothetical protein
MTEQQGPDPAATALAAKLMEQMLSDAGKDDLCPHCVGLELIYLIAKEMTANTEVDPGELFNAVHIGIRDGEDEAVASEDSAAPPQGSGWTLH